ncbi:MAG: efflux RND transporter periplasmic adaptor subunit [Candidatus Obscuribacterales bacterium]|jgi:cobalt-zinc-cadmium efflux system membrane fusion protein|nr:efflux RND transporter periplasmic adaptor subunit [Candidatus Obscuribacterales bacterium]
MFNWIPKNFVLVFALGVCLQACGSEHGPASTSTGSTETGSHDNPANAAVTGSANTPSQTGGGTPHKLASFKLTDDIVKRVNFQTEVIQERVLGDDLHITGHIAPNVGKETDIATRFSGRVLEVKVKPGDYVVPGQVLAIIDSHELSSLQAELIEAQSKLRIAIAHEEREKQIFEENLLRPKMLNEARTRFEASKVHLELAHSEFKRMEGLHKEKIAAEKDYLSAKAAFESAKLAHKEAETGYQREEGLFKNRGMLRRDLQLAEAETLRERQHMQTLIQRLGVSGMSDAMIKDLLRTGNIVLALPLRSRTNGIVTHQDIAIGEMVHPDKQVFTITDLSTVLVVADVPEVDLSGITIGSPVKVKVSSFPHKVFTAKISYVSDTVNPETRTLAIRAVLDNRERKFKVNMFADIELKTSPRKVLACPKAAVQDRAGQKIVFLKKDSEFKEREVELGVDNEHYFEVLSGLKDGDVVVTQGSLMLRTELIRSKH